MLFIDWGRDVNMKDYIGTSKFAKKSNMENVGKYLIGFPYYYLSIFLISIKWWFVFLKE